jgi:predicted nucleic acid-binding protein
MDAVAATTCRDPKDDKFLALALAADADVIVSSDEGSLIHNPWLGIVIVTPSRFLKMLNP